MDLTFPSNDMLHAIGVILVAVMILFYGERRQSSSSVLELMLKSSFSDQQNGDILASTIDITTPNYLLSNSGTHSYPYLAGFLTFACLLVCFLVICLVGPRAGR